MASEPRSSLAVTTSWRTPRREGRCLRTEAPGWHTSSPSLMAASPEAGRQQHEHERERERERECEQVCECEHGYSLTPLR